MNCQDHLYRNATPRRSVTRRWFFQECGVGLGAIALALAARQRIGAAARRRAGTNPLAPKQPHFPPKAKRVIFLFMAGAPSHLELFDYKPRAGEVRRQAAAGRAAQGLPRRVHQPELEAARAEVQVRQARPVRRGAVRAAAAPGRRSSTTSPSSSRW